MADKEYMRRWREGRKAADPDGFAARARSYVYAGREEDPEKYRTYMRNYMRRRRAAARRRTVAGRALQVEAMARRRWHGSAAPRMLR